MADRVGTMLRGYLDAEQRILLAQATRVLGDSLEEVSEISEHNDELIEHFDAFSRALAADGQVEFDELRERFDSFCAIFERHRDAERAFYTLYSTILFPAGAATD